VRINVVVAGIDVTVVFERQRRTAFFGKDAEAGTQTHPVPKGYVE
jgi:hypothetical protein